jgi:hypothetical protein
MVFPVLMDRMLAIVSGKVAVSITSTELEKAATAGSL